MMQSATNLVAQNEPSSTGPDLVEVAAVDRCYDTPVGVFHALQGVNLTFGETEFVAVVGPSGSGKSTLLNILSGIDRPTSGDVLIAGVSLNSLSTSGLARWRSVNCGVILQSQQLIPALTAAENVKIAMDLAAVIDKSERRERAHHLLGKVGLAGMEKRFPDQLSGGQQQRVAIARSLANRPTIIVADEPTAALDSVTAEAIYHILADITVEDRTTIICSTHDESLAARTDHIIRVHDGIVQP